jgi:TolB protein
VRADFERSGVFRIVDSNGDFDETSRPNYASGAAAAPSAGGRLGGPPPDGRFDVRYKLWDVVRARRPGRSGACRSIGRCDG